jgi:hypothetical protein
MKQIDMKHHIEGEQIIKTSNGEPIPDNEPTILFRGRDRLSLPMLKFYRELCVADGCTLYQVESVDTMIQRFEKFAETGPMKQPGVTKGR